MKKILTLVTILFAMLIGLNANAQSFNIGYENSVYSVRDGGSSLNMNGNGMYLGVDYDMPVSGDLVFTPGLFVDYVNYNLYGSVHGNAFYLRVPLHLKYAYRLDNMFELFGTAGPALSYALGGKIRYHEGGISYTEQFFDEYDQRFDIPLGLEIGANINKTFKLTFGYDFGLLNQAKDADFKLVRNVFRAGIGYNF